MIFQRSNTTSAAERNCVRVYLPETLTDNCLPARWSDYSKWLIGRLYLQRHLDRRYKDEGAYIPLSSKILERILPKPNYKPIVTSLSDFGVIEINASYRRGEGGRRGRCKGYRLTPPYWNAQYRLHRLDHPELVGKLNRLRESQQQQFLPVHRHLQSMFDDLDVVGDYPTIYLPLATIKNGDYWFSVCEQGRVHTNLTNLDKEYRKYLRWRGEPLWAIDIVNSQPLILALTLYEQMKRKNSNDFSINDTKPPQYQPQHPTPSQQPPPHTPYVPTLSSACQNDDFVRFLQACVEGRIYDELARVTGLPRDVIKKRFFSIAYGDRRDMDTQVGRAFQAKFPRCYDAIRELKPQYIPKPPQASNAKTHEDSSSIADRGRLARQMQQLESNLVINQVCERIRREYPEACLLTIHDCLVTTQRYKQRFAEILREEFNRTYRVEPRLRVSSFSGE